MGNFFKLPAIFTKVPRLVQGLFPQRLWQVPGGRRELYLTFDDGPIPEVTPWVLEQLKKYKAKATFFCIGDNINKHPKIFQQVVCDGHSIGNHTFNHLNGWKTSVDEYIANTLLAQLSIEEMTGRILPKLFRPPYGKVSGKQAQTLQLNGYKIVMWDVLSQDYNQNLSVEKCVKKVIKHAEGGSIIVFHDSLKAEKNLRVVLPAVLQHFSSKGYSFGKL